MIQWIEYISYLDCAINLDFKRPTKPVLHPIIAAAPSVATEVSLSQDKFMLSTATLTLDSISSPVV